MNLIKAYIKSNGSKRYQDKIINYDGIVELSNDTFEYLTLNNLIPIDISSIGEYDSLKSFIYYENKIDDYFIFIQLNSKNILYYLVNNGKLSKFLLEDPLMFDNIYQIYITGDISFETTKIILNMFALFNANISGIFISIRYKYHEHQRCSF